MRQQFKKDEQQMGAPIKSSFGFDYAYQTDTDDESKYVTRKNKRFSRMSKAEREAHLQNLWRICNIKAFACSIMINQLFSIQTKLTYFGGHFFNEKQKKMLGFSENRGTLKFVIRHDSKFKKFWDMLMLGLITYTIAYAPFRTAFMRPETSSVLFAFEMMTDLLLAMDIFISFFCPYERMDGSLETNAKKVAKNYLLGSFFFDLVAVFPTEMFEQFAKSFDGKVSLSAQIEAEDLAKQLSYLRIIRITKLLKIFKYNDLIWKIIGSAKIQPVT